ncbi:MAG: amidohydrolase family protein [Candidatus Hermodarchaeota archaeon]
MRFDILIKNGRLIDGTGNPWFPGDVGIKNGKIVKILPAIDDSAKKIIDATGHIVCPGFIDMHSHSDAFSLLTGEMESYIRQGITTCVNGQCGTSLAPIPKGREAEAKKRKTEEFPPFASVEITWNTFASYLDAMDKIPCFINQAYFVGFDALLYAGQAGEEDRPPTSEELDKMKSYLAEAMKAGAFGLSTGLLYPPQAYSKTKEIVELAKVVAQHKGYYFSHIRNEGEFVVEAVKECIEITEKSGCIGGNVSHHKVSGRRYWGASKKTLQLIEDANNRGVNITCDQYPYNRGSTSLRTLLPPWVHEGGLERLLERIQNPKELERIRKDIEENRGDWENFIDINGYDNVYLALTFTEKWKPYQAKSLVEITQMTGAADEFSTLIQILVDENAACSMTVETMGEEDIRRIMKSRYQMFGTDAAGIPFNPDLGTVHPRFYGTFPRVLGKYVREEQVLTLEEAIRKMTSFPAQRLGLKDRGLLREGMWADIVVFNPNTVIDKATFEQSHAFPEGIPYVIVNGTLIVEGETIHKVFPGKVLRH